jgi:hypothetical protein
VIECTPAVSELVGNTAWAVLSRTTFPRNVLPSKKDTEPAGIVEPDGFVVTAAVNVTILPVFTGFAFAATVVLVEFPCSTNRYAATPPMTGLLARMTEVASSPSVAKAYRI